MMIGCLSCSFLSCSFLSCSFLLFPPPPSLVSPLRWGILGCGDVCEQKSGPAFYKASNAEPVAVMRRDATKVQDFAKRHSVARFYTDASQLLADEGVDVPPPPLSKEKTDALHTN
jgi:hypothetical protein